LFVCFYAAAAAVATVTTTTTLLPYLTFVMHVSPVVPDKLG